MKLRKLIPAAMLMLASFGLLASTTAAADSTTAPTTTNVTIHKLQVDISAQPTAIPNDGRLYTLEELAAKLGVPVEPLAGVTFKHWTLTTGTATLAELDAMSDAALDAAYPTFGTLAPTAADGTATVALGQARHYFREIVKPPNVHSTIASPFILGLPQMNVEGTGYLTDIHLYPKNVTVYGKVELTKKDDFGAPLAGATFQLYKGVAPDGVVQGVPLATDGTGKLSVAGLPFGDYYFVETVAPTGYMLNPTPLPFSITVSEKTAVVSVERSNYVTPTIDKWVTAIGTTQDSFAFNTDATWILKPKVPGNIEAYTSFVIRDELNAKLTYTGNLVVKIGDTTLTAGTHYTATVPTGTTGGVIEITLTPAALANFTAGDLINNTVVTFTTQINNQAIMGQAICNVARINYNDGILPPPEALAARASGPGMAESDQACVFTGGKVFKKVAEAENGTGLAGAQFKVATNAAGTVFVKDALGNDIVLTSGTDGTFSITGLDYDLSLSEGTTYYLVEILAPQAADGTRYNLLQAPVAFAVTGSSYYADPTAITSAETAPTALPLQIINKIGFQIPQTGGLGTALFTIAGIALMGGSGWLLRRKKGTSTK